LKKFPRAPREFFFPRANMKVCREQYKNTRQIIYFYN
jgi:hypothetical protein